MKDWKQKKGIRKGGDSDDVVITKYTISLDTAKAIKKSVSTYGSQGRALQVATEMLIRMEDPPAPEPQPENKETVRVSVRLWQAHPRIDSRAFQTQIRPRYRTGYRRVREGAENEAHQTVGRLAN